MRLLLLITAILATGTICSAQSIKGLVTDSNHHVIAGATISLLDAKDSSLLRTTISDSSGRFAFLAGNQHKLLISVGAQGFSRQIVAVENDTISIQLLSVVKVMNAVEVVAKKPMIEVRPDKIVFNVENSVNAAGNSAFELLRKSPGVLIDNNDNISMLGTGVAVYIDGKPSPLNGKELAAFLRSLQGSDVEAIELIKNPSARYDAAGTGGIINIRLKKNKSLGANGSISSLYSIGIFAKYNSSLAMNYRNKKINAYANFTLYSGNNESWMNLYREQKDSIYDQKSSSINKYNGQNMKAGIDYFMDKKNTVGIMASFFTDNWNDRNNVITPILSLAGKNAGSILAARNTAIGNKQNININLNHQYTDTAGTLWSTDIDYGHFTNRQDALQPNTYYSPGFQTILEERNYQILTARTINLLTLKTDYEQSFARGQLSAGLKTSFVQTDNDFNFSNFLNATYERDIYRSNAFTLSENIYAAYISYRRKIKKWDLQAGMRAEQTRTTGRLTAAIAQNDQNTDRVYTNLFPSFAIAYSADKNNGINLNFSRRINRPGYQSLNPFESKLDELTYQKGNPFLKPEYTNSISVTHSYRYKLNTSIGYTRTTDFSAQITDTIEGKRNFIQQRNAGVQENYFINISYPFSIAKWWNVYLNAGGNRMANKVNLGPGLVSNISVVAYNFYNQHTITLPRKYLLEVSGFYNSPSVWGGTFLNKSFWGVDAGVQKKMLKDKLTLKITVSDVFGSMHWQGVSNFGGLYMKASGGWESRQFKINCTYRFGRKEIKVQRNRTTGSDDINKRL